MDRGLSGRLGQPTPTPEETSASATSAASRSSDAPSGAGREWQVLAPGRRDRGDSAVSLARLVTLGAAAVTLVLVVVWLGTTSVSRFMAERDAIASGTQTADLLASGVFEPRLTQSLLRGDEAALDELDHVIDTRLGHLGLIRVKIFDTTGRVVYSDERRLVGQRFVMETVERAVLDHGVTRAAVTTPEGKENEFEAFHGRLLEIRRPLTADDGQRLLLEVYGDYAQIEPRAASLWRTFVVLEIVGMVALLVLLAPVLWWLMRALARAQRHREEALRAAIAASDTERRRIAGTLHDGPVQELTAASLSLSAAASAVRGAGHDQPARAVDDTAVLVRRAIASLRTLLVELYPSRLRDADLDDVLDDLAAPLRSRGIEVSTRVDPAAADLLDTGRLPLLHRVARECLRNAAAHSGATHAWVHVGVDGRMDGRLDSGTDGGRDAAEGQVRSDAPSGCVVVEIGDDGRGFEVPQALGSPRDGHVGLTVLADTCRQAGAYLAVSSAPGHGTRWRLRLDPEPGR